MKIINQINKIFKVEEKSATVYNKDYQWAQKFKKVSNSNFDFYDYKCTQEHNFDEKPGFYIAFTLFLTYVVHCKRRFKSVI